MGTKSAGALHLLTAREIMASVDGAVADGGGLYLQTKGVNRSWLFRYSSPAGRRREMGLGVANVASPKASGESLRLARELAQAARELVRKGLDPIDEREGRREAERLAAEARKAEQARQSLTLERAARDYHERVIEPTRTPKHAAQWISSLDNHMPVALWPAPLDTITAPALLAALAQVGHHERARNVKGAMPLETISRIRQRLDAIFEDAIFHGRCTANPAAAVRRKMAEQLPAQDKGRFAALPYREAPAVMHRLQAMPGTAARALELGVLTASRTAEVLGARWQEFDLDAAAWLIPAARMKAGEDHLVPLSPRAMQVLRAQHGQHADLVFPSSMKADSPLSNMAMLVLLKRMGLKDRTTVHGLCRATFSTWANETGAGRPDVIEACLAHEEGNQVRAAYNRAQFNDERRTLLVAWATYLAGAQVLPFAKGGAA